MLYGYCRISTQKQSIERQIRNILSEYPTAEIKQEVFTGTKLYGREVWNDLYKKLQQGDTVVFDSVSRMSRNATEGYNLYMELFNKGINLVFLKEHYIDTEVYRKSIKQIDLTGEDVDDILIGINKYLFRLAEKQIVIAFEQAEKEVSDLQQRTKEGLRTAKENGIQLGQKQGAKLNVKKSEPIKEIIKRKSKDFGGYCSDIDVMSILANSTVKIIQNGNTVEVSAKLSRNTYYKYKREIAEELSKV